MGPATLKPAFFATPAAFRAWLKRNHAKADQLLVGFHKRDSGHPCMTWPESVDQALCFGWIDGIRRRIDDASYSIRFTPRRASSTWSAVNIRKVAELNAAGLMEAAGLEAYARRSEKKSAIYSYEQRYDVTLPEHHQQALQSNPKAWAHFQQMAPGYQYSCLYHIVSAKREDTRLKRLNKLIAAWANGQRGY